MSNAKEELKMNVSKSKCCHEMGGLDMMHLFSTMLFIGKACTWSYLRLEAFPAKLRGLSSILSALTGILGDSEAWHHW